MYSTHDLANILKTIYSLQFGIKFAFTRFKP